MTIREMIHQLEAAGRAIGYHQDVVYIVDDQPADILSVEAHKLPPSPEIAWAWSGAVAVITLQDV